MKSQLSDGSGCKKKSVTSSDCCLQAFGMDAISITLARRGLCSWVLIIILAVVGEGSLVLMFRLVVSRLLLGALHHEIGDAIT